MTTTELTAYSGYTMPQRTEYANMLAGAAELIPSGLWSRGQGVLPAPSPGKIFLALETGDMLGLHPVAALQGIHVIDGKATMSAALMQAVIRSKGHRLRVQVEGTAEGGDLKATATLTRSDDPDFEYRAVWTPQRAVRATLLDSYNPDENGVYRAIALSKDRNPLAWQKSLEQLLKARAISEVAREGGEDALLGVHYTPEEIGAQVDVNGELAEAESPIPEPEQPKRRTSRAKTGTQGTRRKSAEDVTTITDEEPVEREIPPASEPKVESKPEPADGDGPSAAERIATVEHADLPEPAAPQAEPEPEPLEPEYDVAPNGEVIYREPEPWGDAPADPGVPEYDASWPFGERAKWLGDYGTDNEMGRQLWLDWQNAPGVDFTQDDKTQLLAVKAKMEQRVADQRPAALA